VRACVHVRVCMRIGCVVCRYVINSVFFFVISLSQTRKFATSASLVGKLVKNISLVRRLTERLISNGASAIITSISRYF